MKHARRYLIIFALLSLGHILPSTVATPPLQQSVDVRQFVEMQRFGLGAVNEIALNSEGNLLAAASTTGLWVYNLETWEPVRVPEQEMGWIASVAWSADGTRLAYGGVDSALHILDTQLWEEILTLRGDLLGAIVGLD